MISFNWRFVLGILFFALGILALPLSHGQPWLNALAMSLLLCGGALIRYARSNKSLRQILFPSGAELKLDAESRPLARKAIVGLLLFIMTMILGAVGKGLYNFSDNNPLLFIFFSLIGTVVGLSLIYPYLTYLWSYRKQIPRSLSDPPPWWDRNQ